VFYRFMEIAMYLVVGWLTGWLSDRLRAASESERQARNEVERAYANLKTKTDELFALEEQLRRADRLAALGQLTAGLAHEIRNPLASIKTSVEILRSRISEHERAPDEPDFSGIILEETARLDHILTEFLQFARAEQTRASDEPHCTSVLVAARKVLDLAEAEMRAREIRVSMVAMELDVSVALCESHLRQVLLNLLLNSVDAMPDGGEFRIHSEGKGEGHLTICVEDTGPGVPSELAGKVFDPFFSTKEQGTGLGLSIVERILDSHGGSIALAAGQNGATTRFVLRLPLA
jgi:signal transduction histidine kinase